MNDTTTVTSFVGEVRVRRGRPVPRAADLGPNKEGRADVGARVHPDLRRALFHFRIHSNIFILEYLSHSSLFITKP
jgi:hypothetical protein